MAPCASQCHHKSILLILHSSVCVCLTRPQDWAPLIGPEGSDFVATTLAEQVSRGASASLPRVHACRQLGASCALPKPLGMRCPAQCAASMAESPLSLRPCLRAQRHLWPECGQPAGADAAAAHPPTHQAIHQGTAVRITCILLLWLSKFAHLAPGVGQVPGVAVKMIQGRAGLRHELCTPLLGMADQLGVSRAEAHRGVLQAARHALMTRVQVGAGKEALGRGRHSSNPYDAMPGCKRSV